MIWHILKKDLRRLQWSIVAVTAFLATLLVLDSWRYDSQAGLSETALNLFVPLAWSLLIASSVHIEPLTTDNAFWLTRPYRRSTLLVAKLAFAVLTIHLPLLIAHGALLVSHGFSPFAEELIWKQLLVLFAIGCLRALTGRWWYSTAWCATTRRAGLRCISTMSATKAWRFR